MWRLKHMMGLEGHQGPGGSQTAGPLEGKTVEVGRVQVQVRSTIAQGGFAFVYLARCSHSGRAYALKHIVCSDPDTMEQVQREVSVLMALRGHPNIVTLHAHALLDSAGSAGLGPGGAAAVGAGGMGHGGASLGGLGGGGVGGGAMGGTGRKEVFLLMEHCERTLVDVMAARGATPFDEKALLLTFRDVCNAVFAMHCQHPPIAHRDLKAENMLQCGDGSWRLCDFGSTSTRHRRIERAEDMGLEEDVIRRNTTPAYRAPELWDLFQKEMLSEKVDIWALGCLLYRMAYFRSAFDGESKLQVLNGRYSIPDAPRYSAAVPALVRDMLAMQPDRRPDVLQVWRRVNELLPPEMRKASPDWPPLTPKPSSSPAASATGRRPSSPSPQHLQLQQQRDSAPHRNTAPGATSAAPPAAAATAGAGGAAGSFWANFDSFPATQTAASSSAAAPAPPAAASAPPAAASAPPAAASATSTPAAASAAAAAGSGTNKPAAAAAAAGSRPSSASVSASAAERVVERRAEEERRGSSADGAGAGVGMGSDSGAARKAGSSPSASPSPPRSGSRLPLVADEVERLRGELQRVLQERDELRVTCSKLTLVVQTQQADIAALQAALVQQQQLGQGGAGRGSNGDSHAGSAARGVGGGSGGERNGGDYRGDGRRSQSQTNERERKGADMGATRQEKSEEEETPRLIVRGEGEREQEEEAEKVINLRFEDIGSPVPVSYESLKGGGGHRGHNSNSSNNTTTSSSSSSSYRDNDNSSTWRRASAASGASGAASRAAGLQAKAAGEAAHRRNSSPAHNTQRSSSPPKSHLQQPQHQHQHQHQHRQQQQQQQQQEKEQGYWPAHGSVSSSALPSTGVPATADPGGAFATASASYSSSGGSGRGSVTRPRSPLQQEQTEGSNNAPGSAPGSWKESAAAGFGAGPAAAAAAAAGAGALYGGHGWESFGGASAGTGTAGAFSASGFEASQPQQQQQQQQYTSVAASAPGFHQPSGWAAF
ncbi:hypothetical protein CLOM_g5230 [Closterium sp. NIES-68]|nr:hypothetical protein CLOM_g5230 [Closterium sp. NIES-68]GJP83843.1 hypothetical protein CLOP_g13945 [Closterium sp. NIES-67]